MPSSQDTSAKTNRVRIRITRVDGTLTDIPLPRYATPGASGMDLCAAVAGERHVQPGETTLVPTGFRIEIPMGYEAQVRPRSGLALKHGIGILNAPGTIDADYRGEVGVILTNFSKNVFIIKRGDRIAQMVIMPVVLADWEEVGSIDETARGAGGFGSTGTSSSGH